LRTIYKNPIMIGKLVEKDELDTWIEKFRERELEFDNQVIGSVYRSKYETDSMLYDFCKSAEMNFKCCFNVDIIIDKGVRNFGGMPTMFPAIIVLRPYDFCADMGVNDPDEKQESLAKRIKAEKEFERL